MRFYKCWIILGLLFQGLCLTQPLLAEDITRVKIGKVHPESKDTIYCSIGVSHRKLEILVPRNASSKFISLKKYLSLNSISSNWKTSLRKRQKKAQTKCNSFKIDITTPPGVSPTQPPDPPTITPTPSSTSPSPSPTADSDPQFEIASQTQVVSSKFTSGGEVLNSNISIECVGCSEPFTIELLSFDSSLFESASLSGDTSLNVSAVAANQNLSTQHIVSVVPKPLQIGTGAVILNARYRGATFAVSGMIQFQIQSDSVSYPSGLFVSRNLGSDNPSQAGSSTSPLATFKEAMNRALAQLYSATGSPKNVVILLGDGVHLIDATISIQQNKIRQSDSLTIIPWDNARPVLFLGREIPGNSWSLEQGLWKSCFLGSAAVDSNYISSTLYRNLEPLAPARFPNSGMLTTVPLYNGNTRSSDRFTFNESGLPSLPAGSSLQVTFVDQYITLKSSASISGKIVSVTDPAYQGKFYSRDNERHEFYIEGQKAFIDGQVTSAAGDAAYEFAQEGGCVYHNHPQFDPAKDIIRYALPSHSGLLRIHEGVANSGAIELYGVQLAGGALGRQSGSGGPNWGNPQTNHSLIVLEAASNIRIQDSLFGPTAMAGIIGYRDVTNINVAKNVFKNISGPAVSIIGYDFRSMASAKNIMIENNAFVHPNPATLMSRGISLGNVGSSIIRNNYFKDLYQSAISVSGLRYYYNALTWCQRVECPRFLGKISCTDMERAAVCQCSSGTCSNIAKLSWENSQEYNPTRDIVIQKNFVEGGLTPVNDAGLIYVWGTPYGDSSASDSCSEDPEACKDVTNISVVENVTLNKTFRTGENHFVHYYADDGANSTDFKRNVAINPNGSAILVFAKGQGGVVEDNMLIGSDKSSHAMLNFAEFDATSNPGAAPFLDSNKELNRKKVIRGNAFVQIPSSSTPPVERGSFIFFSNWDPISDDGYGKVLQESSGNIFVESEYGKSSRKAVFLRFPTPELFLTIPQWRMYQFSGGRLFDSDALTPIIPIPTEEDLLSGVLPNSPELQILRSKLPNSVGLQISQSRYSSQLAVPRTSIALQ